MIRVHYVTAKQTQFIEQIKCIKYTFVCVHSAVRAGVCVICLSATTD